MPALHSVHLFLVCLFLLLLCSPYWAYAAPCSLQDATVGRAFSASEVEPRILAPRMTLLMTSIAPLKTTTAAETLCLYRTDTESAATATSARPAVRPGCCPLCPWTERCTARWTATEWSPWSGALQPSRPPPGSSCQRWGQCKRQLLGRELRLGQDGVFSVSLLRILPVLFKGRRLVQSSRKLLLSDRLC